MLAGMTARQLREWMVFADLEPFDNDREDYLVGSIITLLANVNRGKARKYRPFTLDECTPVFGDRPKKRKKTWQEMKSMAREFTREHNSDLTRKRR